MQTIRYFVEQPETWRLDKRLVRFSGWVTDAIDDDLEVRINGSPMSNVDYSTRADAASYAKASSAVGWRFFCDAAELSTLEQGAIILEVFNSGHLISRSYFRMNARYRRSDEIILFVHIPKTAGTSLRSAMEEYFPHGNILSIYDEHSGYISIKEFNRLGPAALIETDFLFGHFQFGLHEKCNRPFRYITFMRDPFTHLLSSYHFSKLWAENRSRSVSEALASGDPHFDNPQTRYLAGNCTDQPVATSDLERAIDNIKQHFAFVGLTEFYDASIDKIRMLLGCPLASRWDNQLDPIINQSHVDVAEFRRAAIPNVAFDLQLYSFVLERFWGGSNEQLLREFQPNTDCPAAEK